MLPQGFQLAGVHAGLKQNPQKEDVALFVASSNVTAAGVYTKNLVCAAPVVLDRSRTPSDTIRAIVLNSGNANACTGEQGDRDAAEMTRLAAAALNIEAEQVLVLSTGIIGEYLPMEKIAAGIESASKQLANDQTAIDAAARAMLTTDLVTKIACREVKINGKSCRVFGFAKGSGMIGPNMATMLGIILTDAHLDTESAQTLLSSVTDQTFNCVSVDGHTSTNDTVFLLASGVVECDVSSSNEFADAVLDISTTLARAIADDGEGATHLITVDVRGCRSKEDAATIARSVALSPLVKTAIAGADPNWGRIVSAAGYAGVEFDVHQVALSINGFPLFKNGEPLTFDAEAVSDSMRSNRDTEILLTMGDGDYDQRHWTSDLTADYVKINADYHT